METSLTAIGGGSSADLALTAGLLLDVTGAAAERGCAEIARPVCRYIIARYSGSGYAAHRRCTEIGLAELRAGDRR